MIMLNMIAHLRHYPSVQQRSKETSSREELVYFNTANDRTSRQHMINEPPKIVNDAFRAD